MGIIQYFREYFGRRKAWENERKECREVPYKVDYVMEMGIEGLEKLLSGKNYLIKDKG